MLLPFKVYMDAYTVAGLLEPFPKSICVGDHYGDVMVLASFFVGVILLVHDGCLHIVVVVLVVQFGV